MKNFTLHLFLILVILCGLVNVSIAQPQLQWFKTYGGTESDIGEAVAQTEDGGFIAVGGTMSDDIDVEGNHEPGRDDWWVIKVDRNGVLLWQKCLGTVSGERARDIQQTPDNGCIVTGYVRDEDNIAGHNGISDYWVVKLDSLGEIEWQGLYGGTPSEVAYTLALTSDGGYAIAGSRLIFKLDASGNIEWEKNYGGTKEDIIYSIQQTTDGGYVGAGYSESDDGDVGKNQGLKDVWVIKLDIDGELEWSKTYGGPYAERANDVVQSEDGGFMVGGYTFSVEGDVANNYGEEDVWILKLDADGELEWEKTYGGLSEDRCSNIHKSSDGGYIVSGRTRSLGDDIEQHMNPGLLDIWILKINENGTILWEETYGGTHNDQCFDVKETQNGGLIATGNTYSNNGDVDINRGSGDLWMMKLKTISVSVEDNFEESGFTIFPNPNSGTFMVDVSDINTPADIVVYDVLGKSLLSKTMVDESISLEHLSSGIYFVTVNVGSERFCEKVVVH